MPIRLYNTLSGKIEDFQPIDTGRVRTLKSVLADLDGVKNAAIGAPSPANGDAKK